MVIIAHQPLQIPSEDDDNQELEYQPSLSTYGLMIAFAAAMGGLLFGYEIGVVSQVLEMDGFKLQFGVVKRLPNGDLEDIDVTTVPSLTTFTFLIGCLFGSFIVSYIADSLGRKLSIITGGCFFLIGGGFQFMANIANHYFVGRFISGLGIGILSMCSPLYISESAPPFIRGTMLTVQQLMITLGILIAASVNSLIMITIGKTNIDLEWRLAMGAQCFPALFLLIMMLFMPESPRWLANQGRDAEALETIAKLRGKDLNDHGTIIEYRGISESIAFEKSCGNGEWSELFGVGLRKRLIIAIILQMWQQWTGINVILYYQGQLLKGMGVNPKDAAIPFTLANDFINFVATFPGMHLIDKLGRKKLLIFGGFGIAFSHSLICIFVGLSQATNFSIYSWGAIISVYFFIFSFASTWGYLICLRPLGLSHGFINLKYFP